MTGPVQFPEKPWKPGGPTVFPAAADPEQPADVDDVEQLLDAIRRPLVEPAPIVDRALRDAA